eukprot:Protomagalhaensia_wolfi_Nauph_80__905@NODE_1520_length_1491_cov_62_930441_g1179_i0_p1_GENE_NODE_1520_length_1491_cov_62_930441_g1179_i0NODE_1520_length_1491_cov_62_930441_g1179_i0_p1_ORF_typecomplete_len365_score81_89Aldo_ket_red/PF00248_21/4_3e50LacI/PF00356_21/0_36_NODE_1520_length_1491_cov_62_930441_g1179_i01351229
MVHVSSSTEQAAVLKQLPTSLFASILFLYMQLLCARLTNGVLLPALGFGTWELNNDDLTSIQTALLAGYRHIDTASMYKNQTAVGKAIATFEDKTVEHKPIHIGGRFTLIDEIEFRGNFRIPHPDPVEHDRKIFVTGKISTSELAQGEKGIRSSVDLHLEQLGRQCGDLMLLHFPCASGVSHDDPSLPAQRIAAWKVLEQLYKEKKVRAIGVSNYMFHHLKPLVDDIKGRKLAGDADAVMPMVNQFEFSPYCLCSDDLLALCDSEGIVVEAYSTLGSSKGREKLLAEPVIQEIAKNKGVSPATVCLRWALEKNFVILPRSRGADHIEANAQCLHMELTKEEEEQITELGRTNPQRFCWDPTGVN